MLVRYLHCGIFQRRQAVSIIGCSHDGLFPLAVALYREIFRETGHRVLRTGVAVIMVSGRNEMDLCCPTARKPATQMSTASRSRFPETWKGGRIHSFWSTKSPVQKAPPLHGGSLYDERSTPSSAQKPAGYSHTSRSFAGRPAGRWKKIRLHKCCWLVLTCASSWRNASRHPKQRMILFFMVAY